MFQGNSDRFLSLSVAIIGILLVYRRNMAHDSDLVQAAFGLQVGGALGNLVDRFRVGHVIDFIDFKVWPVCNVADTAIVSGVLVLAWHLWREERRLAAAARAEARSGDGQGD